MAEGRSCNQISPKKYHKTTANNTPESPFLRGILNSIFGDGMGWVNTYSMSIMPYLGINTYESLRVHRGPQVWPAMFLHETNACGELGARAIHRGGRWAPSPSDSDVRNPFNSTSPKTSHLSFPSWMWILQFDGRKTEAKRVVFECELPCST